MCIRDRLNHEGATIVYTSHYMEEVEQLCTRIAIMDKGRTLATGTKEELKAMINRGETVRIDLEGQPGEIVAKLRELPAVASAKLEDHRLVVRCKAGGQHNLVTILDALRQWDVAFGRVFSELPTLNDVFLEITGKELRD